MKKRILAIVLSLTMAAACFTGCGDSSSTTVSESKAVPAQTISGLDARTETTTTTTAQPTETTTSEQTQPSETTQSTDDSEAQYWKQHYLECFKDIKSHHSDELENKAFSAVAVDVEENGLPDLFIFWKSDEIENATACLLISGLEGRSGTEVIYRGPWHNASTTRYFYWNGKNPKAYTFEQKQLSDSAELGCGTVMMTDSKGLDEERYSIVVLDTEELGGESLEKLPKDKSLIHELPTPQPIKDIESYINELDFSSFASGKHKLTKGENDARYDIVKRLKD